MKAITYTEYGSPEVLQLTEAAIPVPKDDEVLIRIRAASVNALDLHFMHGFPSLMRISAGRRKPKFTRLGVDVAGEVQAIGGNVTQLEPGDSVFGVCRGSFAEYACATESRVVTKPDNISFEQAAAVPVAAITALQGLRDKGKIQPGQKVLINGAGGGVGTFAVQIAKMYGAEVTAVTRTGKVDTVRAIGADHVIDYTREDFTKGNERYDVIFDLGLTHSMSELRRVMTSRGKWLVAGGTIERGWARPFGELIKGMAQSLFVGQKLLLVPARMNREDLTVLQGLLEDGRVAPLIDRTYPLSDVREAMRYVETGSAAGKVVLSISG